MSATHANNHSHAHLMTDMSIDGGRYTLTTVRRGWQQDAVSAKAVVSKGFFSLHLKTKLALQYTFGAGRQLSGGEVTGYTSGAWQASPEVVFTPRFGMFTYRAAFTLNRMKTDGMGGNSLFGWKQNFAYTQTIGRIDITAAAVHYRNELQQGATVCTLLADASVVWRMKKVRLSLDVRNIFERAVARQADRVAALEKPGREDLMTLTLADLELEEDQESAPAEEKTPSAPTGSGEEKSEEETGDKA